ncbi:hypothetical protein ABFS82_09G032500 [Erythranthe guttata]|uniref:uncharacterized protein LOC105959811 isoform X1 n=1 Tax=Erythranthe guttata TaxID=4155 RepID=UPI00064DAD25|nr:PREDICTED: uncharacterized protein LOC105959811 isoform X1 [Erythranthe guttata]XP_012839423.1 PREDICTED: uncharacterized protein LOC105959811 isoform X1 [Erythranthe guttata]|eukprot:XP_012839422.1 PREDICTED: uncharacterized protein LOC105959811 isoform X1 [Erythranthe guttata]
MGRKKRNVVNRSKPSKSPSPAADPPSSNPDNSPDNSPAADPPSSNPDNALGNSPAADTLSSNPDNALGNSPAADAAAKSEVTDLERYSSAKPSLSHSAIKLECQRALTALRRGNYTRALRLMNDFSSKYGNSPHASLIHRVHGIVCVKVAFLMEDTNAKQRHLRNAIESARKAAMLCPNSVEFGLFYASLMYEAVDEAKEYEEVVQECKRALAIENPVDPAEEGLQEESQNKISTAEERVARVQNELRSLIQKSVLASLKALEIREENFCPIPITRVPEDPNEIKKVAKTPEERRKEIEERVTAARFVQQNSEYAHNTKNDSKGSENGRGSGSRKNTSTDERRDLVLTFWNSMNLDGKKECLRIKISDLKAHFSSSKDGLPSEMLDEALSFGETNKVWRFWECCRCNEKFADSGSLMQHVVQEHMRSLLPETQSVLPQNVDNEWAEMLLNIPWKPLDLNASITMHQKQSKPKKPDLLDESSASQNADEYECDGDQSKNWPVSDDAERAKLLERIHSIFESLIRHKYMASSHVSKIMNFAVEDPLSICFLGAPRLEKILIFLQEISQACGLNRYSDKSKGGDDSNTVMHSVDDTLGKIVFSSDASFLVLDEHFLPDKIPRGDGVNNASSALTSSDGSYEHGSEQLAFWQHERAEKAQQGMEILQLLEEESSHLRNLCERKREQLSYEAALQALGDRCLEEGKKRVHVADFVFQSYDSVLNKRREELIENENGLTVMSNIVELDAISNVLADADSVNINRCVTSLLCALESGGGDERRTKDYMQQMDSYIEAAIQKQKEAVSVEISRIDARLMRIIAEKQKLEVELGRASSHDFRSILIPLVKSFMGARLEDLAEKDAVEKSDAAREAILAELALDSKKVSAGVDSSRHSHDRTKDKKKSKDNRKNKDSKVINSDELQDQTAEEIVLPSAHGEGGPGSVIAVPAPDDDALQLNDEEYKRRIEIEAEERKLEEMLEYQRRIENEAKQKRLAEKQQELSRIVSDSTETVAMADDEKYASEHSKESLVHKDGFADTVDGIEQVTNSDELQDPTAE